MTPEEREALLSDAVINQIRYRMQDLYGLNWMSSDQWNRVQQEATQTLREEIRKAMAPLSNALDWQAGMTKELLPYQQRAVEAEADAAAWKKKYGEAIDDLMVAKDAERYALRSEKQARESEAGCLERQKELQFALDMLRKNLAQLSDRL